MSKVSRKTPSETWWLEFFSAMTRDLQRRQEVNKRYSIRSFATSLGISNGAMSELLNGKRGLTLGSCIKVASKLKLTEAEHRRLMASLKQPVAKKFIVPTREDAVVIKDWLAHAILGLYELDYTGSDAPEAWIAKKLNVQAVDVRQRTELLLEKGLLAKDKDGRIWRETQSWDLRKVLTDSDKAEINDTSLELNKMASRKNASAYFSQERTIPANDKILEFAKRELEKLADAIDAMAESSERPDELMRVSFQVFKFNFVD